jgi:ABC-type transport system substrate-binding protein
VNVNAQRRWLPFVAALVGITLIAMGCTSNSTEGGSQGSQPNGTIEKITEVDTEAGPPQSGGKVVYGLNAESDGFGPAIGRWSGSTYIVGFSMMDPLAAYDANLEPKPYLAQAITSNADFKEWTLKLRPGVSLHNSKPVDAALVKLNLDAQKSSALTGETMAFVDKIETPDNLTVVVKMNKPWSTFPHILTAQVGAIGSEEANTKDGNLAPVGSGPFIFDRWNQGQSLTVHKNPNYWRKGYPFLDNIEFRPMNDIQSRAKALEAGDINLFETNDANQILTMTEKAKNKAVQLFSDQKGNPPKIFVGLNVTKPPFDDINARLAVAYAGNVEALSEDAYQNVFPPAFGPFSPNSPFYVEPEGYPHHDLAKAKEYAAKYEQAHGKPIEFSANITSAPEVAQVAQVLKEQQKEAGITVNLETMEQLTLIAKALTGDYQATGFILFGSPHLDREYVFIASKPKAAPAFSLNFTRLGLNPDGSTNDANQKIVDAMDAARATADPAEQKKQYAIVQAEMAKNLNFLFLVGETNAVVFDKNTHGVLDYTLPNESGGDGEKGMPTVQTFMFNVWVKS